MPGTNGGQPHIRHAIRCINCGFTTRPSDTPNRAVESWNGCYAESMRRRGMPVPPEFARRLEPEKRKEEKYLPTAEGLQVSSATYNTCAKYKLLGPDDTFSTEAFLRGVEVPSVLHCLPTRVLEEVGRLRKEEKARGIGAERAETFPTLQEVPVDTMFVVIQSPSPVISTGTLMWRSSAFAGNEELDGMDVLQSEACLAASKCAKLLPRMLLERRPHLQTIDYDIFTRQYCPVIKMAHDGSGPMPGTYLSQRAIYLRSNTLVPPPKAYIERLGGNPFPRRKDEEDMPYVSKKRVVEN